MDDVQNAPAFFEQTWDLSYRHALGATTARFFEQLKARRLFGVRCPQCQRVLFPPRSFCDRCHTATEDWIELEPRGTLEMFTIVTEPFRGAAIEPPYVLAYARPDGADTAAVGYLRGIDLGDVSAAAISLEVGAPVEFVFVDEPEGSATDFWFRLVPSIGE